MRANTVLLTLLLGCKAALAHDTWFEVDAGARAGSLHLALGTGERFPEQTTPVAAALVERRGCRHDGRSPMRLQPRREDRHALQFDARWRRGAQRGQSGAITCWVALQALDIEIEPAKVRLYLDEIRAAPGLRQAWRELHSRGQPWRERYRKHARVEHHDTRLGGGTAAPAGPVPLRMDIVLDGALDARRAGERLGFRVLRDGVPLAGQPIELRSERAGPGIWLTTDGEGRASAVVPVAGRWLLRGTDLRLSSERPGEWDSDFVTLAFSVAPSARVQQRS